jgi:hypothetical protein
MGKGVTAAFSEISTSDPLIPFPTLSMMLRSGHPDAGAAALWITRRSNRWPMCISCRQDGQNHRAMVMFLGPAAAGRCSTPRCRHGQ